jgi:lysozyme-related protein Hpa2
MPIPLCALKRTLALAFVTLCEFCLTPADARAAEDCFAAAAAYDHVNPLVLRAIAWQESHGNADAMHVNRNGSVDYGMMQINSIHLPDLARYRISVSDLMNPCSSVFIAAWYLHRMVVKYGNTWTAVGAYHSETPVERNRYALSIREIVERMSMLAQGE